MKLIVLRQVVSFGCVLFCSSAFVACDHVAGPESIEFTKTETKEMLKLSPLPVPPASPTNAVADNPDAARFGQMLFFNMDLSINGEVSCATCHKPELGFSDGKAVSEGLKTGTRNASTLWNTAYQRWFFWDGRADSLWSQGTKPFLNKNEMGTTPEILRLMVINTPELRSAYGKVFGGIPEKGSPNQPSPQLALSNLGKALEAYQRLLITANAPFDRWLARQKNGNATKGAGQDMSPSAIRGLKIFVGKGKCILCHSGPNFSDGEFHNTGLPPLENGTRDRGRYKGIGEVLADSLNGLGEFSDDSSLETNIKLRYLIRKPGNLGEFKTPTLRNISVSAPYMHDGRFATLRETLAFYSKLPGQPVYGHREETLEKLELTDPELDDLEAFLHSLTDESLDRALLQPVLPDE